MGKEDPAFCVLSDDGCERRYLKSTPFDFSKQEKCKERNNNCKDKVNSSLRTADVFTVVASLPPKKYFRRKRSDDRKCVCCSQARSTRVFPKIKDYRFSIRLFHLKRGWVVTLCESPNFCSLPSKKP